MPDINKAYQWAINTCNAPNIGYSQPYRNQRTVKGITYYDCSSFIWYSLLSANFDVLSAYRVATGANYSGNAITTYYLCDFLLALGFTEIPISSTWEKGDILWKSGHTEMVYSGGSGKGRTMGAHNPNVTLANQVSINSYESTSPYWTRIFRYGGGASGGYGASLYVISALAGNSWRESTINPN